MVRFIHLRRFEIVAEYDEDKGSYVQGCQLPDFSLRFQAICHIADFSTTFSIRLKTKPLLHITKPPASTLEFKNFDFILQNISVTLNKNGKSAPTQLAPSVKHFAKFPDFFETQCWQPWLCNFISVSWKITQITLYLQIHIIFIPKEITVNLRCVCVL